MDDNSATGRILKSLLIGALMFASLPAMAVSDGSYKGNYQGKAVTAVLETISTTVTGMLTIGQQQYLIKAEKGGKRLDGELNSMAGGDSLPVSMSEQGTALQVEVGGDKAMQFTLQRQ